MLQLSEQDHHEQDQGGRARDDGGQPGGEAENAGRRIGTGLRRGCHNSCQNYQNHHFRRITHPKTQHFPAH